MSLLAKLGRAAAVAMAAAALAGPVSAQDAADLEWRQYAFESPEGVRAHALSFAIPETDAWLFNAECAADDEGPSIPVMLALDFGTRDDAEEVEVRFRTEAYDATFAGTVSIQSEEYAGIAVEVGVGDALWPALRRGHALDYGIVGEDTRSISLRGSNDPVRRFTEACLQLFAEAETPAAPASDGPYAYECQDGVNFELTIDNSRSDAVATITINGNSATLVQVPGESGTRYAHGDLVMQTEGDVALMITPQERVSCSRRD